MNAFNTTWDLLLNRPYGDGGGEDSRRVDPENGWTMLPPLYCRAHVNGPINDPSTPNGGWSVEIALPIAQLQERQEAAGCGAATPPASRHALARRLQQQAHLRPRDVSSRGLRRHHFAGGGGGVRGRWRWGSTGRSGSTRSSTVR